jgi:hypothetical protein
VSGSSHFSYGRRAACDSHFGQRDEAPIFVMARFQRGSAASACTQMHAKWPSLCSWSSAALHSANVLPCTSCRRASALQRTAASRRDPWALARRRRSECKAYTRACCGHYKVRTTQSHAARVRVCILRRNGHRHVYALIMLTAATCEGPRAREIQGRFAQSVATADPAALTAKEAATIGQGLEAILRLSATPAEAVDEPPLKYPALSVLVPRHVWFRPRPPPAARRPPSRCRRRGLRF